MQNYACLSISLTSVTTCGYFCGHLLGSCRCQPTKRDDDNTTQQVAGEQAAQRSPHATQPIAKRHEIMDEKGQNLFVVVVVVDRDRGRVVVVPF